MPKTLKSVSKGYSYNTRYTIDPRRLESIIRLLEDSRDYLSKATAVHIVLTLEDDTTFNREIINKTMKKIFTKMNTRLWLLYC